ncbi:NACHT, LRR and PYD domains-containing protein 12-like isoform X2 [Rhinichthys klamathensis goyatoka]|uniref:NACHT, LRR and PYD domains-containing protein 12-like isoform X2 n=1 Tax=Rhinichthys klamathensis goyatoka TaxID=3034132 RepID=UPI0024B6101B|nr:NACHT, LRR and PYD domains-containing protein 12-like isoform X2 [Rhinichthys klamathensis goyatoka]
MMETVLELLIYILEDLEQYYLKRFRSLLKQHEAIRAGKLENADATDIVNIMLKCFGEEEAVKITLNILRKINQNQLAEELQDKYTEVQKSLKEAEKDGRKQDDLWVQGFLETHKLNMKKKVEHIFECKEENEAHLKDVFTELFITEGDLKEVNQEHEIRQIDDTIKPRKSQNRSIKCNDVFSLNKSEKKKIVLTKGIAGIGKTVLVHRFILDWAEKKANQDIDCVFLLPFRKINCIKDRNFSLHEFLQRFNPELKDLKTAQIRKIYSCKLAFIFDGLDESRLPLDFDCKIESCVEERSSIDQLFTSLVNGTLLPSARIWVTSRPAAANQIPLEYVLFTEVKGFTDQQKDDYFKKRIKDEIQASRMISHIKKSRCLYIMCYIPMFCWIIATVLRDIPIGNDAENINTTLTEMYIHFLLIQMNMKSQKCDRKTERERTNLLDSNKTMILKLAKLAFEQLKKENYVFYVEDLKACGIEVSEDFESTGMLTEIFQQEAGLHEMKVFCFVHLSVQEFFAAVHVFLCYLNKNMDELQFFFEETQNCFSKTKKLKKKLLSPFKTDNPHKNILLHDLLKKAVEKAIQSQKGHLDLFLRFLLGISLKSNQNLLRGLISQIEDSKDSVTETTKHITEQLQNRDISPETSVNLFYGLLELNDKSLYTEIQRYFRSTPERRLSSSMCSLMAYVLLMSKTVLDELDLKMYKTSGGSQLNLLPAVRCCRKAILSSCALDDTCCETVALALQIPNSPLIELDMSDNELQNSGVKLLSDGLKSPNCQLNTLRLANCNLTDQCCEISLASVLQSSNSHLIELDMSGNELYDSGVKLLSDGLNSPNCQLKKLRLAGCRLTGQCCGYVASVLQSSNSRLIELDMRDNGLQDSGVKLLSDGLKSPNCQLKKLRLAGCILTCQCCEYVASVLQSSNSCLKELDMSVNSLCDSGVKLLSDGLKSPNCQLEILGLSNCEITDEGCCFLASALRSNPPHLRELDLSDNRTGESGGKMLSDLRNDPNCTLNKLKLTPLWSHTG